MNYRKIEWRESDQKVFVADYKKIKNTINRNPLVTSESGIKKMLEWLS